MSWLFWKKNRIPEYATERPVWLRYKLDKPFATSSGRQVDVIDVSVVVRFTLNPDQITKVTHNQDKYGFHAVTTDGEVVYCDRIADRALLSVAKEQFTKQRSQFSVQMRERIREQQRHLANQERKGPP